MFLWINKKIYISKTPVLFGTFFYIVLGKKAIQINIFLMSPQNYIVGTHLKHHKEMLLISIQSIHFHGEIRKVPKKHLSR